MVNLSGEHRRIFSRKSKSSLYTSFKVWGWNRSQCETACELLKLHGYAAHTEMTPSRQWRIYVQDFR